MKNRWYVYGLLIFLVLSCHKKEFPKTVVDEESVFYFNGTLDGNPITLKPGVDNYYMYSSVDLDTNKIYAFMAELRARDCSACTNGLRIRINDFKFSSAGEPALIDSSLTSRAYPMQAPLACAVAFKSTYNQTAASYLWDFGDQKLSTEANPTHTYSMPGTYLVSLRITGTNSCQQYIRNVEKINYPAKSCSIIILNDTLNTLVCSAAATGPTPHRYAWDFGDGYTTTSNTASHTYAIPGTYPVSLRVIDADNDTAYAKYNGATQTNPMPCLANYSIKSVTPLNTAFPFRNITISWMDEAGLLYTSDSGVQPESSYFKILSVEDYDTNEKNEKTKKIKVQFQCRVFHGGSFKTFDNVEAVLAVAYQ